MSSPNITCSQRPFDRGVWDLGCAEADVLEHLDREPPARRIKDQFCPFCGFQIPHDFVFCPNCGRDV